MKLNKKVKRFIADISQGLYKKNTLQISKLLEKLNLKCFSADYPPDILGSIIKNDDDVGYTIYVNKDLPKTRQRFIIAHEIGHYISYLCGSYSQDGFEKSNGFEDKKTLHSMFF